MNAVNILSHAMNSVIMFLDILIVAHPLRLYHVIQPICFGVSFGIFSFIYYLCDGVDMYVNMFIYSCSCFSVINNSSVFFHILGMEIILFTLC